MLFGARSSRRGKAWTEYCFRLASQPPPVKTAGERAVLPPEGIGATGLAHWIRKPLWTHDCKNMMKRSKSQFTSKKVCTVLIELCFFFSNPSCLNTVFGGSLRFNKNQNPFRAFLVAQTVNNLPAMGETRFDPWVETITWRRAWQPTPVFLPGEFQGQRSLVGCGPWDHKDTDTAE